MYLVLRGKLNYFYIKGYFFLSSIYLIHVIYSYNIVLLINMSPEWCICPFRHFCLHTVNLSILYVLFGVKLINTCKYQGRSEIWDVFFSLLIESSESLISWRQRYLEMLWTNLPQAQAEQVLKRKEGGVEQTIKGWWGTR